MRYAPFSHRQDQRQALLRRARPVAATCAALGLAATSAAAAVTAPTDGLTIEITGIAGSGLTKWSFSGRGKTDGAVRIDDNDNDVGLGWQVGPVFYVGTDTNIDFSSFTATLSAGSAEWSLQGVGAQDQHPNDVFGIAIENRSSAANFTFGTGTVLSFAGMGIAQIDITEFAAGVTHASLWDNRDQLPDADLDVTFVVTPAVVPLPATLPLLAGGLGLLVAGRRRRS